MSAVAYFIGFGLTAIGIFLMVVGAYNAGNEAGIDEYKYVSNEATYSTNINGKKVEYTYGKINELIQSNEGISTFKIMEKPSKKEL